MPIDLKGLGAIADLLEELWEDRLSLEELMQLCGSFLTIQKDTVYFIHQSAKDFFITGNSSSIIPRGCQEEHGKIAYRSLDLMLYPLRENMCGLQKSGTPLSSSSTPQCYSLAWSAWSSHLHVCVLLVLIYEPPPLLSRLPPPFFWNFRRVRVRLRSLKGLSWAFGVELARPFLAGSRQVNR